MTDKAAAIVKNSGWTAMKGSGWDGLSLAFAAIAALLFIGVPLVMIHIQKEGVAYQRECEARGGVVFASRMQRICIDRAAIR